MMPFPSTLPPALVDLTVLRLAAVLSPKISASTFVFGKRPTTFRRTHQAAVSTSTNDAIRFRHPEKMRGGLAVRTNGIKNQPSALVKELERRVEALDETIQTEVRSYMS
jgi:hypothetical protein